MTSFAPVFLITGTPGVGKSTTADALLKRFPFGLHIPIDDLREWVVSGISHPVPTYTEETARQFQLARQSAALIAKMYSENGFAVAIDDVITVEEAALFKSALAGIRFYKALLYSSLDTALARNADRRNKTFDPSILVSTIERLHREIDPNSYRAAGWLTIDNSELTLVETVDRLIALSATESAI